MEYLKNIYNYFTTIETVQSNITIDDDDKKLELVDYKENIDKYIKTKKLIESNEIVNGFEPKQIYKPNGIIDLNKTREFYQQYTKHYFYCNIGDLQIENVFNNFYIIRGDEVVMKHNIFER